MDATKERHAHTDTPINHGKFSPFFKQKHLMTLHCNSGTFHALVNMKPMMQSRGWEIQSITMSPFGVNDPNYWGGGLKIGVLLSAASP